MTAEVAKSDANNYWLIGASLALVSGLLFRELEVLVPELVFLGEFLEIGIIVLAASSIFLFQLFVFSTVAYGQMPRLAPVLETFAFAVGIRALYRFILEPFLMATDMPDIFFILYKWGLVPACIFILGELWFYAWRKNRTED